MTDTEGFIYVNRSGKGKKRRPKQTPNSIPFPDLLQRTRKELVSSGWWDAYRTEIIPRIVDARRSIVGDRGGRGDTQDVGQGNPYGHTDTRRLRCLCLGLGPPATSANSAQQHSLAQLCVLLDLCAELAIAPVDTELFDPAFEEADISALRNLGLEVLGANLNGAYAIKTPTLVFMPHCDIELYDHFLRVNWSEEGMGRVILVGNDLAAYVESKPARILEAKTPCVARIAPRLRATLFPPSSALPGAFNNTALQVLCRSSGADKDGYAWSLAGTGESGRDGEDGEVRQSTLVD